MQRIIGCVGTCTIVDKDLTRQAWAGPGKTHAHGGFVVIGNPVAQIVRQRAHQRIAIGIRQVRGDDLGHIGMLARGVHRDPHGQGLARAIGHIADVPCTGVGVIGVSTIRRSGRDKGEPVGDQVTDPHTGGAVRAVVCHGEHEIKLCARARLGHRLAAGVEHALGQGQVRRRPAVHKPEIKGAHAAGGD